MTREKASYTLALHPKKKAINLRTITCARGTRKQAYLAEGFDEVIGAGDSWDEVFEQAWRWLCKYG